MRDILFNSTIINIITYVGLILTIYSILKVRHRRIFFQVLKRKECYVITIWNACAVPIFRENIHDWFFQGVTDSRILYTYATDASIKLDYKQESVIKNDKKIGERIHFSFDFLNQNEGYMILIYGDETKKENDTIVGMYGRLRGENVESFAGYVGPRIRVPVFTNIYSAIFLIAYAKLYFSHIDLAAKQFFMVMIIMMGICWFSSLLTLKQVHMPWKLRMKLFQYQKSGYKYIKRW